MTRAPSISTLTKRADFLRLNKGRKHVTPYLILRYGPSGRDGCRVGLTVTTKCGNAVTRNRIKRRLRALVKAVLPEYAVDGTDYVLIARAEAAKQLCNGDFSVLKDSLAAALGKLTP